MPGISELVSNASLQIYEYGIHVREAMIAEGRCFPFYVMSYVQEGQALLRAEGATYELEPRSVILLPPRVVHDHIKVGDKPTVFMWWHFDYLLYDTLDVVKLLGLPLRFDLSEAAEFESAFARHTELMEQPVTLQNVIMRRSSALEIMARLLGAAEQARRSDQLLEIPECFQEMLEIILSLRQPELSLDIFAKRFNMHPTYLSNRFRSYYGVAPIALHRKVLLRRAQDMLAVKGTTVNHVADALGFKSASVFSRFFTSKMGVPPSKIAQKSESMAEKDTFKDTI
ncbi:AraC family transcriptional regulator [Eubacteriales bacterium OttesenSCG-928-N13]|nr:AraC family transcriptional regulator [Eubacteriales bacterium OttesenSCG-928-N13]